MTSKPAYAPLPGTEPLIVPGSAVLVARLGGTAALLAAAAISASTLYHLGLLIGLGPTTAWLLPAALDIYAACAIFTGYRIPPEHPARASALRNARLALGLTVGCNALDHVLTLAGSTIPAVVRDGLLVTVASLPPLIVERLLHLQTLLVPGRLADRSREAAPTGELDETQHLDGGVFSEPDPLIVQDEQPVQAGPFDGQTVSSECGHCTDGTAQRGHIHRPGHATGAVPVAAVDASRSRHRGVHGQRSHDVGTCLEPAVLTEVAMPVYRDLAERCGRRPAERAFHLALTDEIAALVHDGCLPGGIRPPSLSTAKRIRGLIENGHLADKDDHRSALSDDGPRIPEPEDASDVLTHGSVSHVRRRVPPSG